MKKIIISSLALLVSVGIFAQKDKKELDKKAIKAMTGCFEVTFNFAETFEYSKDSTYKPSKKKHDKALEWAELVTDKNNEIQIQHLLIVGSKENPYIVKHWRQDWLYQNRDLYEYNYDNKWNFVKLPKNAVKGQWTQKVYQVDDSPRYEGSATWVHVDGKSFWENKTSAPLPRREITKRSDYNVTVRGNRHEITKNGWVHDQDNDKVIRENGKEDIILAQEKGYNTYVKVPDSKCIAAQKYWKENYDLWKNVRKKWNKIYKKDQDLSLHHKVKRKRLFSYLFKLKNDASKKEINEIIDSFVKE